MVCGFSVCASSFWRLEREGASLAGSRQSFPVFQPVRAAATVWKRVRRLLQNRSSERPLMAESASTPAQPSARPTSPQIELNDLVIQACDDADNLYGVMHAYTALEKLVDAGASADSEEPSGPELSALLSLLNEKLMARIEAINATAAAVRAALPGVALHAR
jgi:hypothetical protein